MSQDQAFFITLINEYLSGAMRPERQKELFDLLDKDAQLKLFFEEIVNRPLKATTFLDVDAAYLKQQQLLNSSSISKEPSQLHAIKPNKKRIWLSVAAAVLVLAFSGLIYYYAGNSDKEYLVVAQTKKGEQQTYKFPDGTTVWLNGETVLSMAKNFGTTDRRVQLSGEGYFQVAKNPKLPFIVNAGPIDVKVLGTVFNVRAYPDEKQAETALVEGKVELTMHNNKKVAQVVMAPGDKIAVVQKVANGTMPVNADDATPEMVKAKISYDHGVATNALWRENKLSFDGDEIPVVMSKIEKWYGVQINISNQQLRNMKFSGVFKDQSINAILNLIKESGAISGFNESGKIISVY